jgi:hypothetical protein
VSKPRGRPFSPGNTLGRGRPKGSRNKAQAPGQHLLDQYSESLTRKCIAMALQGDQRALRICMERINPARQDACVQLSLPSIRTAQDVEKAADKVTQASGAVKSRRSRRGDNGHPREPLQDSGERPV